MAIKFIGENEAKEAITKEGVHIINFFAEGCGPCKMMGPIFEEISNDHDVYKINVDDNKEYAGEMQITSIPTTFVYKDGKLIDQIIGFAPRERLLEKA